jgi:ABC-2 type transport system ATP-binding protein
VIEINNLYKYYGERKAVGPLSFSIEAGEIVGLLGLNGAGKTTTLRILACDLLPSSGSVKVDGLDVVDQPHEVRSRIGYLPDTPPLYGEMTVREYLIFAARLRGMTRSDAEARVIEVEEATELGRVRHDVISSLSHGYRQRVGIAQAIVHRPRLLVLDEPISGLDPVQIVEMRELLRGLRGSHTIIISSHILSEISETCDRILVIREGQIGASGTEAELSTKLLHGVRAEITVAGDREIALSVARALEGVTSVTPVTASEPGEGISTLQIEGDRDLRQALCRALVGAGLGVLELRRNDRELESVFLRLAGTSGAEAPAAAQGKETPIARAKTPVPEKDDDDDNGDEDDGTEDGGKA